MPVVSIGNVRTSVCVQKSNSETKTGEKHNSISNTKR